MNDFFIGLELTRHCNLRCSHCFRADLDQVSEIPFETVEKILKEAKSYHRPHIAMTGGETTLHSRFSDILNLITRYGYTFHFVTNGWNYKTLFRDLYPLFGDPRWVGVSYSLDGATAETHDAIRGKGSFNRVLGAIAVAATHKLEVVVQMIVHRNNRHEMESLALLCSKLGVTRLHIAHLQPTPEMVSKNLLHSPAECRDAEREISTLSSHFTMPIILSAGFFDQTPLAHCRFLKMGALNIDFQGRLTACCQLSNLTGVTTEEDIIADLNQTSLEEAHQKLIQTYQQVFNARLEKMKSGQLGEIDQFHCWSCMKHFHKVDWMNDFPENEWVQEDPYFKTKEST